MRIRYKTSQGNGLETREVVESVADFACKNLTHRQLARLLEMLCHEGVVGTVDLRRFEHAEVHDFQLLRDDLVSQTATDAASEDTF